MEKRICAKCETENSANAIFCKKCRNRLVAAKVVSGKRLKGDTEHESTSKKGVDKRTAMAGVTSPAVRKLVGWIATFDGDESGLDFAIREGRNELGTKAGKVNLLFPGKLDPKISGHHCVVQSKRGLVDILDSPRMSTNGTFVDIETANEENYPKLYEDAPEKTQTAGSFQRQTVTFVDIQDQRVRLRDNSLLKLGETVFKVKLL